MFDFIFAYKNLSRQYNSALIELGTYKEAYIRILNKYNDLVELINTKGGEDFLYGDQPAQFTAEEVAKLIRLCHPDKHNNSAVSNSITQKLLELKEELK